MRLIHTPTLQLKEFFNTIPDYVILSHTWGDEEITFDDFSQPHVQKMRGYEKVRRCCEQAIQDGFEWAWCDTVCIDKRSSTELGEAINSMWKWYWRASICYAYLSDVPGNVGLEKDVLLESFKRSRWFTRGWTLQELLAPAVVEFYDSSWTLLGTKSGLLPIISAVTRIHEPALRSRSNIRLATVAQRLSWAATRETSREEDIAYCLLGLLNVSIPLLYGEGKQAFYRLQLELIRISNDHTLFAWEMAAGLSSTGFLADSPAGYLNSGNVRGASMEVPGFTMTNRGLCINFPCITPVPGENRVIALLNCYFESSPSFRTGRVGIALETHGSGRHFRIQPHAMLAIDHVDTAKAEWKELCIIANPEGVIEGFLRAPFAISLNTMPSFDADFQVLRMAKYSVAFQDGQYAGMSQAIELQLPTPFNFEPDDFAGILFRDGVRSFLLAFGQREYSIIWLVVQPDVQHAQFDDVLKRARVEIAMDSDLYRDAADAVLADGSTVSILAKKMRQNGIAGWRLLIQVTAEVVESDTTMVDGTEETNEGAID